MPDTIADGQTFDTLALALALDGLWSQRVFNFNAIAVKIIFCWDLIAKENWFADVVDFDFWFNSKRLTATWCDLAAFVIDVE